MNNINNIININVNKNMINKCTFNLPQPFYKQKRYKNIKYKSNNMLKTFLDEKQLKPVYIYENLNLDKIRKTILNDLKGLSGIYLIFNNITGDYYIGSASTNRFYARFSNHLLYFKGNKILKHAVKKYNLSNFTFLILELFPEVVNKENNKKLLDLEDFYLKSLLPNYNILTEAGSSFGYKHTELDRIKMKVNYSLERRILIGNLNKDKKLSSETVEKIREKALMRGKVYYSEKALLNMKKKSKPVILYNLNNTIFGEYSSIREAANSINCSSRTISRALRTDKNILKRRFVVKYKMLN
jgi:group I intron endonuclease